MKCILLLALLGCAFYGQDASVNAAATASAPTGVTSAVGATPGAGGKFNKVMNGLKTAGEVMDSAREFMKNTKSADIMKTTRIPYHVSLAASYGNLNSDSIKALDEELKVMIAGTNRAMMRLNIDNPNMEPSFEDYVASMMQNSLLEPSDEAPIFRNEYKQFGSFGLAGKGTDQKIIKTVAEWFDKLVQDADVLAATKIDIEDYGNIVAATDAAIESFETIFLKQKEVQRSIVDVGVIRYPDLDNPFFKLFRIKLAAYRKSFRVMMVQKDESGIKGTYEAMKFVPRKSVMDKLRSEVIAKAAKEAEDMFS